MISAQQATGEGNFLGFLRTYLMTHKYKTVDVYDLKSDFTRYVKVSFNLIYQTNLKNHTDILEAINWDDELRNSKYPILETDFRNLKINASENLAKKCIRGEKPDKKLYESFDMMLKMIFMINLEEKKPTVDVLKTIDEELLITENEKNPEILLYWLRLNIPVRYNNVKDIVKTYLENYGRGKYIIPTYKLLYSSNKDDAKKIYNDNRKSYNPRVVQTLDKILK